MDPNATYTRMLDAFETQDHDTAADMASALLAWLMIGGFAPDDMDARQASFIATGILRVARDI